MGHPAHCSPLHGLMSLEQLARRDVLGFSADRLHALAGEDQAYLSFSRVTSGKKRVVSMPLGDLLTVHSRMFDLLDQIQKPDYLHSGVKGRSHVSNARAHLGAHPTAKLDIRRFFASIDVPRVRRFFGGQMACAAPVAELLTRLCTFRGHVPIGSRMSQHLAYFAARPLLEDLHRLSTRHGVLFTCYVDDLSFSGAAATPSFLWLVKKVVHHHGYGYHNDHHHRAGERKIITGVVVAGDSLAVPPRHIDQIRQDTQEVRGLRGADRRKAVERLVGRLAAASHIDARHRVALEQLQSAQRSFSPASEGQRTPG